MKKSLLITVFVCGCGASPEVTELQVPESTPGSHHELAKQEALPTATFIVPSQQKLAPPENLRIAVGEWLQCATDGHRLDFTGRLFTVRIVMRESRADFTGLTDAEVRLGSMFSNSRLMFSPVDESAGVRLSGHGLDDELFFNYSPREGSQEDNEGRFLSSYFLETAATIRLKRVSAGNFSGTLDNHFFFGAALHCWSPNVVREFNYNSETGRCENEAGEKGFNPSSVIKARETGDGHCVDMTGWSLNGEDFSYPNLPWDVRGSKLNGATISFADMIGADFRGAKMENFNYGYTKLQGPIDEFTELDGNCEPEGTQIDCLR